MNPKKHLWTAFAIICIIALISAISLADGSEGVGPTNGSCGDNLVWNIENGVFTVSGTGTMTNYTYDSGTPWEARKSSITEVVIGNGVTSVGSYAFSNCTNLATVTLPSTLKTIGSRAFEYAEISEISFPNGLERIEDGAFIYTSLVNVTVPNTVTYLGSHAFADISELKTVTLSASITEIPFGLFVFDRSLESVHIPDGVTTIRQNAFSFCNVLSSIELPDTVTLIETSSFNGSEALQTVYYAGTPAQSIGISVGTNNGPLSSATWHYSDGSSTEGFGPTSGTCGTSLTWELVNGVFTVTGTGAMTNYTYDSGTPWETRKSSISEVVIGNGVTSVGSYTFSNCTNLQTVTFPNSLKTIGSRAFEYAEINQVSFPSGLERIEDGAFIYTSLTSVIIPDSVTYLGNHAFADISELKTVTLSASITEIPFGLFVFDRSLESVHIPDGVTTIRQNAFSFCNVLSSIELPDTVTLIETSSFNGSETLQEVRYSGTQTQSASISIGTNNGPLSSATWYYSDGSSTEGFGPTKGTCGTNVTWELNNGVFTVTGAGKMTDYTYDSGTPWEARKSSITKVIIGNGVTSVGSYTFSNCTNLQTVTFPNSLKTIGSRAFEYAEINQVSFPSGLERIEDGAFIYTSLTSVIIPDSVTYLGNHAFADISELKTVTLSASITEIPFGLFVFDRSLESVQIPDGVTTIRQNAFSFCNVLSSIELPDTVTLIETSSFNGSEELKEVHYAGTQEQADAISIGTNNGPLSSATWFCKPDISKMSVLKLPADLTRVEPSAFEGISCEAVIIPDNCTSIGSRAFADCHNLIYIVIPSSTDVASDAFDGCPDNLRIDQE